jgi:hypothetical protein
MVNGPRTVVANGAYVYRAYTCPSHTKILKRPCWRYNIERRLSIRWDRVFVSFAFKTQSLARKAAVERLEGYSEQERDNDDYV